MRTYEILDLAGLRKRRTIADVLAVLEDQAAFGKKDLAKIRIGSMPLAPGKCVGLVQVIFDDPGSEKSYAVPLPSSEFFRTSSANGQNKRHSIVLLNRGRVDAQG